ncbi:hypothetical protein [Vibrio sp. M260118]|uniref:hypothetical protein n=1 Tax=Vibrio sp. M260118 TaxID=3020896 RepID=UPI002F4089B4
MIRFIILGLSVLCYVPSSHALELLIGPAFGHRTLSITENSTSNKVAEFQSDGVKISPYVSLRTEPFHWGVESNWGISFSFDFYTSSFDNQSVDHSLGSQYQVASMDTEIKGKSLYLTPILYYQFGGNGPERWQYRIGAGLGLGYQSHSGEFIVTNADHSNVGQRDKIEHSGYAVTGGVYFEASYGSHIVSLNGDLISADKSGAKYRYLENNVSLKYQYRIKLFS